MKGRQIKAARFQPRVYRPVGNGGIALSPRAAWTMLAALTALGAALRFAALGAKGLWFDEIHTLTHSMFPPPTGYQHYLFFHINSLFVSLGENSTAAARLYPALLGALSLPILYAFTARLHSPLAGLIAALLLCFQPFHLFYSQEARFYAPMVFYAAFMLWGTLEFASAAGWRRFLWLPAVGLAGFLIVHHQATAIPFVLAYAVLLIPAFVATDWGADAVAQAVPPLRRHPRARWFILAGLAVVAAIVFWKAAAIRQRFSARLTGDQWGATEGVEFAWSFFAQHLSAFGWDIRSALLPGGVSDVLNLILIVVGFALLARRRPYWAAFLIGLVAAAFLAVFAFRARVAYLVKYVIYLQPIFLAAIAVVLAETLAWIRRRGTGEETRNKAKGKRRKKDIFLRVFVSWWFLGLLLIAGQLPGVVRYYRHEKMPVRPQMQWLNRNEPRPAEVYFYGHVVYPVSLYRGQLAERHRLHYFPWRETPGRLEIETLKGAAARESPAYFLHAWPHDAPDALRAWLESEAEIVAHYSSLRGPEYDGKLYRLPKIENSPHRALRRPAAAVDDFGEIGRPRVAQDDAGAWTTLRFDRQAEVGYFMPLRADRAYRVEVEVAAEADGPYFISVQAGEGEPAVMGGALRAGEVVRWQTPLRPGRGADRLRLRYVSDYGNAAETGRALTVRAIAVEPLEEDAGGFAGYLPFPPLRRHGEPWETSPTDLSGWRMTPAGVIELRRNPNEEFVRIGVGRFDSGTLAAPPVAVEPGGLLFFRTRARMVEAYGVGATLVAVFFDAQGRSIGQAVVSSDQMPCKVDWRPWELPFLAPWIEFQSVIPIPGGAASASVGLLAWDSTAGRRYLDSINEIHWAPVEMALLRPGDGR